MSEAASDPSSPSESHQSNDAYFFWEAVTPLHGEEMFVRALQKLGIEMAKAVPERTKREAITPWCGAHGRPLDRPVREENEGASISTWQLYFALTV